MAEEETGTTEGAAASAEAQQQFVMQRVYVKDLSFESPQAPDVFRKEWKPQMGVDLRTKSTSMDDNNYEVVLTITVTAKLDDETAFLVEVQQGGIFFIQGIEGEELRRVLGILCPNMLFPYARETIDAVVTKGTYPALMLAQVNFEALYAQAVQQAQAKQQSESEEAEASVN